MRGKNVGECKGAEHWEQSLTWIDMDCYVWIYRGRLARLLINKLGDRFIGAEPVGAIVEHKLGIAFHGRKALGMQVPHHGIAVPTTKHLHDVVVDVGREESDGSTSPQGACTDGSG